MRILRTFGILLLSGVSGGVYVTLCYRTSEITYRHNDLAMLVYFASVITVLLVVAAALVRFTEWGAQISISAFLVGVMVGVVYDALSDKTMDRNVFPIEAAIWCVILGPTIAFGKELGAWMKNRHAKGDGNTLKSTAGST